MSFFHFCSLCGAPAGPKYARSAQDQWRGETQELCVDSMGTLMAPRTPQFPMVHRSCWTVLGKIARLERYDAGWLKDFRGCLRNISPVLRRVRPEVAPTLLAGELKSIQACPEGAWAIALPRRLRLRTLALLPAELLHCVFSFLTEFSDVENLRIAIGRDPPVAIWKSLWRKYDDWQMELGTDEETGVAAIHHVLWYLEKGDRENISWPHAAAYTTVWKNCELVLKLFKQPQYGSVLDYTECHLPWVYSNDTKCYNQSMRSQKFESRACSAVTMNFVDIYEYRYLCGIGINQEIAGYKGDCSVTFEVATWTGIRLISDDFGFVSVQIRDVLEWQEATSMNRANIMETELRYCEVRWDQDSSGGILALSFDAFKINAFAVTSSMPCSVTSMMWQKSLPAQHQRALLLVNQSSDKRHSPFKHLECLHGVVSITAIVDTSDLSLIAFEFRYANGNVRTIGNADIQAVRLSYVFAQGEKIVSIGCAKAKSNPGIAVKMVTTTCPSGVLFGDDSADDWQEVLHPDGVFCNTEVGSTSASTSIANTESLRSNILSTLGVFSPTSEASVLRATGPIPITFRRTTTQSNHAQQVFIASASLEGTKAVDIYFKDCGLGFAMISGLRLQYSGCKPALLGEDSHDGQTIQLSSSVRTIDVYYSRNFDSQYLIAGLSFTTNDGQASAGICKGENPDGLHINQHGSKLYCVFNRMFTRIALSEEDVLIPPIIV